MEKKNVKPTTCKAPAAPKSKKVEVKKQSTCCSCEAGFKSEVDSLVNEVEGYGKAQHDRKREELNDAFGRK